MTASHLCSLSDSLSHFFFFFFFNDTATTEIYTLSLHDALPISVGVAGAGVAVDERRHTRRHVQQAVAGVGGEDRKSTRLNSSHLVISYAVFCLKKKKKKNKREPVGVMCSATHE